MNTRNGSAESRSKFNLIHTGAQLFHQISVSRERTHDRPGKSTGCLDWRKVNTYLNTFIRYRTKIC